MSVTIKNDAGVIFTFNDGDVMEVSPRITAVPDADMLPGAGPSAVLMIDLNGAKKTITISGTLTVATTTRTSTGDTKTILEQKQWLEALSNGGQLPKLFTSDFESQSYNGISYDATQVMVTSVVFNQIGGIVNNLDFTIEMVVGS